MPGEGGLAGGIRQRGGAAAGRPALQDDGRRRRGAGLPQELPVPLDEGEAAQGGGLVELRHGARRGGLEEARRLGRRHRASGGLDQRRPDPGRGHALPFRGGDPALEAGRQLDDQRDFQQAALQAAPMKAVEAVGRRVAIAEILALVGGDDQEGAVPLAAGAQRPEQAAEPLVGPRRVQPVEGLHPAPHVGRHGHGRVGEGLELALGDAARQLGRGVRTEAGDQPVALEVRGAGLQQVDPDEPALFGQAGQQLSGGTTARQPLEGVEPLVVAVRLSVPGAGRVAGGLVAAGLERLGQGDQLGGEGRLAREDGLVLPGAQAGEQRGHGRHGPARRGHRRAGPVRLAGEFFQVRRQAGRAAEAAHRVGAQGIEGDEDDRARVDRRPGGRLVTTAEEQEEEREGRGVPRPGDEL
ncbi:MAG TPA: hypothetical protein VHU81_09730 [Thermoanaerobaculia bacterium]|nr:hypothetical protein [Thermoanaerobaculia bacterium]